ncbi:hypothetical protein [Roseateles albus]|uniref:Lipoprotein n=1 Tax=Roseateles albus TaxID=2987525 RepID=A0ABT5KG68_9BURK|nr:hypothetical protein [Roseateles albus]MDC8772549.1 hypothetical protein [Roseateles albus]
MYAFATSKKITFSAAALCVAFALTACGDGSDPVDPPAPMPTQINAANMVEVAALLGYERAQSHLVADVFRALPLWFSTGQDGSASPNCSSAGTVNYSQKGKHFSLSANGCKHLIGGRELLMSSGSVETVEVPSATGDDFDLSYKDWVSSLHNPRLDTGTLAITGKVAVRSNGTDKRIRTADYSAAKNGQQISFTFVENVEHRDAGQGVYQVVASAAATVKTAKFPQPLKISLPVGGPGLIGGIFNGTMTITAADGSALSVTQSGVNLLLELRPTGVGTPTASKNLTTGDFDAAMAKVF